MNSIIYYVTCSNRPGEVKIGTTNNLPGRMRGLQSDGIVTGQLTVLAVELGDRITEANRHSKFAGMRLDGEWFTLGAPIIYHVMELDQVPVPFQAKTKGMVEKYRMPVAV